MLGTQRKLPQTKQHVTETDRTGTYMHGRSRALVEQTITNYPAYNLRKKLNFISPSGKFLVLLM